MKIASVSPLAIIVIGPALIDIRKCYQLFGHLQPVIGAVECMASVSLSAPSLSRAQKTQGGQSVSVSSPILSRDRQPPFEIQRRVSACGASPGKRGSDGGGG